MRHLKSGRKLNRTASHRKAMFNNMATLLFRHKKIATTEAKAKELRPFAEKLITKAKHALAREQQGLLPDGHTVDFHNRREVGKAIRDKAVLQELFDSIAPVVFERNGGYTRVIKTGLRRGDAARTAIIELVDYAQEQDGAVSINTKKKKKTSKKKTTTKKVEVVEAKADTEKVTAEDAQEETPATKSVETQSEAKITEVVEAKADTTQESTEEATAKTAPDAPEVVIEELPQAEEPSAEATEEAPKDDASGSGDEKDDNPPTKK